MGFFDANFASKKNAVMNATWGHMFPEPGSKHVGTIILATGNSQISILGSDFPTLCGSPQQQMVESTAMDMYDLDLDEVFVYELSCTLHFYKGSSDMWANADMPGRIIKPTIKQVYHFAI